MTNIKCHGLYFKGYIFNSISIFSTSFRFKKYCAIWTFWSLDAKWKQNIASTVWDGKMYTESTMRFHNILLAIFRNPNLWNLTQNHWWPKELYIDGLVQERRNSIANALELRLLALIHRYIFKFVASTLPPDGLALLCSMTSPSPMLTMFGSCAQTLETLRRLRIEWRTFQHIFDEISCVIFQL